MSSLHCAPVTVAATHRNPNVSPSSGSTFYNAKRPSFYLHRRLDTAVQSAKAGRRGELRTRLRLVRTRLYAIA
jgi:hypothetical protein